MFAGAEVTGTLISSSPVRPPTLEKPTMLSKADPDTYSFLRTLLLPKVGSRKTPVLEI
jgi:hypothetical protein